MRAEAMNLLQRQARFGVSGRYAAFFSDGRECDTNPIVGDLGRSVLS